MTTLTNSRIQSIDILRGVALMGILIVHLAVGFHWLYASPEQKALMPFPEINAIVGPTIDFFFTDKSRTLFAFMFGISFFIQLKSAEYHKKPFKRAFLWRLTILMIFGLLHGHLLFGSDILRYYAAGGLFLLLVYKWSSKSLLILGLFLNIIVPVIATIFSIVYKINLFGDFPDLLSFQKAFMSTSYWENFRINNFDATSRYNLFYLLYYFVPVTGIFLFGICAGRQNYLQNPEMHTKLLKRFVLWGLGLGFFIQGSNLFMNAALEHKWINGNIIIYAFKDFLVSIAVLLISLGYISTLTLLSLRPSWNRFLSILAPAGRMTLTNYIMQSVFLWVVFFGSGFGLYLKIGPSISIFIALALCGLQLAWSYYWLTYFKMGPLEWVWRYANTGKRPGFKKTIAMDNK